MRVAIVNLTSGGFSGGYLKYLRELVPRLGDHPSVAAVDVFVPPGRTDVCDGRVSSWPAGDARGGFAALRNRLRELAPDVVFIPTARWIGGPWPTAVMVRNMEPLLHPLAGHQPAEGLRNLARRWAARHACRRASRIIAVSEHVRGFVGDRWHVPRDRIGLVRHGVNPPGAPSHAAPGGLAGLRGPFIFTAGSIRPARGLEDAIDALGRLDAGTTLVVGGAADAACAAYERRLRRQVERLRLGYRVIWLGHLDREQMAWCYSHADVFLTTTRAEACPNVALEAMSYGCSIVATDIEPMPEFFSDVARYYRPGQAAGLAAVLREALAEALGARQDRDARGRVRAAGFSWDATARHTIDELLLAVAAGGPGKKRSA